MRETAFLLAAALVAASAAEPLPALANLPAQPGAAVVYLLTFPGSGNTWVRHLIQEGTRVYAGSQYHAHQLEENGFPSDALGAGAYARLSVVKSHGAFFEKEALYGATHGHARVVVLRHPCAALVSEFRRMTWKAHAGDASAQQRAQGREQPGLGGEGLRVHLEQDGERRLHELQVAPALEHRAEEGEHQPQLGAAVVG